MLYGIPLAYSHVHCQGTKLQKSEMYLFAEKVVHFVYNIKKIQMNFVEYCFNFTHEI